MFTTSTTCFRGHKPHKRSLLVGEGTGRCWTGWTIMCGQCHLGYHERALDDGARSQSCVPKRNQASCRWVGASCWRDSTKLWYFFGPAYLYRSSTVQRQWKPRMEHILPKIPSRSLCSTMCSNSMMKDRVERWNFTWMNLISIRWLRVPAELSLTDPVIASVLQSAVAFSKPGAALLTLVLYDKFLRIHNAIDYRFILQHVWNLNCKYNYCRLWRSIYIPTVERGS